MTVYKYKLVIEKPPSTIQFISGVAAMDTAEVMRMAGIKCKLYQRIDGEWIEVPKEAAA